MGFPPLVHPVSRGLRDQTVGVCHLADRAGLFNDLQYDLLFELFTVLRRGHNTDFTSRVRLNLFFITFHETCSTPLLDRGDGGGDVGGAGGVEEVLSTAQVDGFRVVSRSRHRAGDGDEVTVVGGGDLDIEALELAFPGVVVVAGLSTGRVVPGRGHGVPSMRMRCPCWIASVSPPGRKSRTVSRRTVIRRQDSGDRGLGDSQKVGDHHLGQVLAKDQQAGHHLVP